VKDDRNHTTTDAGIPVASDEHSLTVDPDGSLHEHRAHGRGGRSSAHRGSFWFAAEGCMQLTSNIRFERSLV